MNHPSLLDIDEVALVRRLLEAPHQRATLFAIRGFPRDAVPKECVSLEGLPGSPKGDIDILLCSPTNPEGAIAIEVKRFKALVDAIDTRVNKLQEFDKGVQQANRLARIGFSQVYLWTFVLVDSRRRNTGKITYDGLPRALSTQIEERFSNRGLDTRVGLIHHEFVQSMDHEPLSVGASSDYLARLAEVGNQPPEVTAWVSRLIDWPNKPLEPTPKDGAAQRPRVCRHGTELD